jgi:hypothetical protein
MSRKTDPRPTGLEIVTRPSKTVIPPGPERMSILPEHADLINRVDAVKRGDIERESGERQPRTS